MVLPRSTKKVREGREHCELGVREGFLEAVLTNQDGDRLELPNLTSQVPDYFSVLEEGQLGNF